MNKLAVLMLICLLSISVNAKDFAKERQEKLITSLIEQQVNQHISIEKSVKSLLTRYPEKVESVVNVALRLYPESYLEIMTGAMHAEPVLACEVLDVMLHANVASPDLLLTKAIQLEPAYASALLDIAATFQPADVENILRVAIKTEPVLSTSVVDQTMTSFPDKLISILISAIDTMPEYIASYIKSAINLTDSDDNEIVTETVAHFDKKYASTIVESAIAAGMSEEDAIEAAIKGGAKKEQLAKAN